MRARRRGRAPAENVFFLLGDPRHRFHCNRVQRENQRREPGPGYRQATEQNPSETRRGGVKDHVDQMVAEGRVAPELVLQPETTNGAEGSTVASRRARTRSGSSLRATAVRCGSRARAGRPRGNCLGGRADRRAGLRQSPRPTTKTTTRRASAATVKAGAGSFAGGGRIQFCEESCHVRAGLPVGGSERDCPLHIGAGSGSLAEGEVGLGAHQPRVGILRVMFGE